MIIFGLEGEWENTPTQQCNRCALIDYCDAILATEAEVPYICEDGNPFSHKIFKLKNE